MQVLFFTLELFQCKIDGQELGAQSVVALAARADICEIFRRTTSRRVKGTEPRLAAPQRQGIFRGPPPTHPKTLFQGDSNASG
jgi:hypothetical protein